MPRDQQRPVDDDVGSKPRALRGRQSRRGHDTETQTSIGIKRTTDRDRRHTEWLRRRCDENASVAIAQLSVRAAEYRDIFHQIDNLDLPTIPIE